MVLASLLNIPGLPVIGGVMTVAAIAFCLARFRGWSYRFTMLDAVAIVAAMVGGSVTVVPLLESSQAQAKTTTMLETLQGLRNQIEYYKAQHNGAAPILFKGTFPQMTHSTNSAGVPGTNVRQFPLGPYMTQIPPNPLTGVATVTATSQCPPATVSGVGGWRYHQPSGRIFADLDEYLDR